MDLSKFSEKSAVASARSKEVVWRTWNGEYGAKGTLLYPQTIKEVQKIVKACESTGTRVKVVASGHSFSDIAITSGVVLCLDKMDKIVSVDKGRSRAVVEGGIRMKNLCNELAVEGLSLSQLGVIKSQSISGIICTGTHGSGVSRCTCSEAVVGVTVVKANGDILEVNERENSHLLPAMRVSLGCLGIIVRVELQCEPVFSVTVEEKAMKTTEVLRRLPELQEEYEYFKFWWFPHTEYVQAFLSKRSAQLPGEDPKEDSAMSAVHSWVNDRLVGYHLVRNAFWVTQKIPSTLPIATSQFRKLLFKDQVYTRRVDNAICNDEQDGIRMYVAEYAFPREKGIEAFKELELWLKETGLYMDWPVDIRFVKKDETWMSPSYGRDSTYIGVPVRKPYGDVDYSKMFKALEKLARKYDARPHWGKVHFFKAEDLRRSYPMFGEFVKLREEMDPKGIFLNGYLERVLGVQGVPKSRM